MAICWQDNNESGSVAPGFDYVGIEALINDACTGYQKCDVEIDNSLLTNDPDAKKNWQYMFA